MLRRYVEQILSLYNYIDGIMVCDRQGQVEYYTNFRPDINSLTEEEVAGKHVLDVYPYLRRGDSSLLQVLATGEPIYNQLQTLINAHGETIRAVNTTLPIKGDDATILGAVDFSRYLDHEYIRKDITLTMKPVGQPRRSGDLFTLEDLRGDSPLMCRVKEKIARIADTCSNVMVFGETGTGKELVAQSIHASGARRDGPFISQNCAAIPASLLEGILFGTEKGSYTGATSRAGLFEMAHGGTLFLDEVNSMEVAMQSKILKAIEDKSIRRIGGDRIVKVDVRVISAVNEDPHAAVDRGHLRMDLFFRLSTVLIGIPPLRERGRDIKLLTRHFIREFNGSMGKQVIGVTEEVERTFDQYRWPGNVRELRNVIEGAFNFISNQFIKRTDLPEYLLNALDLSRQGARAAYDSRRSLAENLLDFERRVLLEALDGSRNLTDVANRLGISKQSLNYKLHKFHLRSSETGGISPVSGRRWRSAPRRDP